jgi:hypothetical protein
VLLTIKKLFKVLLYINNIMSGPFTCDMCNNVYKTDKTLLTHKTKMHNTTAQILQAKSAKKQSKQPQPPQPPQQQPTVQKRTVLVHPVQPSSTRPPDTMKILREEIDELRMLIYALIRTHYVQNAIETQQLMAQKEDEESSDSDN